MLNYLQEGSVELPKQAIPSPKPDPVYITVEDDDDVTVESASSLTSKITNTTTKKVIQYILQLNINTIDRSLAKN